MLYVPQPKTLVLQTQIKTIKMLGKLTLGETVTHTPERVGCKLLNHGFILKLVGQRGSGLIVNAQVDDCTKNEFCVLYYPPYEDLAFFVTSAYSLRSNGPSEFFPGTVGVASCEIRTPAIWNIDDKSDATEIHIEYLQGCFKIGSPPELNAQKARIYGDWKIRLLETIFEIARDLDVGVISFTNLNKNDSGFNPTFEVFSRSRGCDFVCHDSFSLYCDGVKSARYEVALFPQATASKPIS